MKGKHTLTLTHKHTHSHTHTPLELEPLVVVNLVALWVHDAAYGGGHDLAIHLKGADTGDGLVLKDGGGGRGVHCLVSQQVCTLCSGLTHTFLPSDRRESGLGFALCDLAGGTTTFCSAPQPASMPTSDSGPTAPPSPLLACGGTISSTEVQLVACRTSQPAGMTHRRGCFFLVCPVLQQWLHGLGDLRSHLTVQGQQWAVAVYYIQELVLQ